MAISIVQAPDIVLVLCHSFFHDAFRTQNPVDGKVYKNWYSSRFIANLIIEKQAELPDDTRFATTSLQVFETFAVKFHGDKPSLKQKETVEILRNSIFVVNHPSISKLSDDESVLVICDTLYSLGNRTPILISNIPKKIEKAEAFYHKKDPQAAIPYPIYSTPEAELYLRGKYPELSKSVDKRIVLSMKL
jgi:hypothetical protein